MADKQTDKTPKEGTEVVSQSRIQDAIENARPPEPKEGDGDQTPETPVLETHPS